jgi:hypothetical protein
VKRRARTVSSVFGSHPPKMMRSSRRGPINRPARLSYSPMRSRSR